MATAQQVLDVFRSQIGTKEYPANSNQTKYGRWYGLDGEPWCAMFLSWCFYQAGEALPASTYKGFAYTPAGADWFQDRGRWGTTPRVGAVVFYKFPGSERINHVGIVESYRAGGYLTCIEGNTNSAGSRDGGAVLRKERRSYVVGYGYPYYDTDAPAPPPPPPAPPAEEGFLMALTSEQQNEVLNTIRSLSQRVDRLETNDAANMRSEGVKQHVTAAADAINGTSTALRDSLAGLIREQATTTITEINNRATTIRDSMAALGRRLAGVNPETKTDADNYFTRQGWK
jgi:hypothetical protein